MHVDVDVNILLSRLLANTTMRVNEGCTHFCTPPYKYMHTKINNPPLPPVLSFLAHIWLIGMVYLAMALLGVYQVIIVKWFQRRPAIALAHR